MSATREMRVIFCAACEAEVEIAVTVQQKSSWWSPGVLRYTAEVDMRPMVQHLVVHRGVSDGRSRPRT